MERIVVTGMGAVTPVGIGVDRFWDGLINGECGIDGITRFPVEDLPVQFAAEVKDFDPEQYMSKKQAKEMDLFMQYGYASAIEAMKQAGIFVDGEDATEGDALCGIERDRIGVTCGTAFAGIGEIAATQEGLTSGAHKRVSPRFVPKIIGNICAAQIAIAKGLRGPSMTVTTACSSGADAITAAIMFLKSGEADMMLCVGAEAATCPINILGLSSAQALSKANDRPKTACCPFDQKRDGFVMGEGGGCIIIETESHAKKRGAKILAEIAGWANCTDGYHVTAPHPEGIGAIYCMEQALKKASMKPEEIDYINAHGTSTPKGDTIEIGAIKTLFGDAASQVAVSSTKSATGHMMGAGGVTETIVCIKATMEDMIPPTLHLTDPDPACDLDLVPNEARKTEVHAAMSNAFGFGGQNSSIIVKKYA